MATVIFDQTDILEAFRGLRDIFNTQVFDELRGKLHSQIIWQKLHHEENLIGDERVIAWLLAQKTVEKPSFEPDEASLKIDGADLNLNTQVIRGTGKWGRPTQMPSKELLRFRFIFNRSADHQPWFLLDAFGKVG